MIIDTFTHLMPPEIFEAMNRLAPDLADVGKRVRNLRPIWDLDARFRTMDGYGDYRQIVCLPHPPLEEFAPKNVGPELMRIGNDALAEICAAHKDRFAGFVAGLYMKDVDACVAEIHRAITRLGACGVQMYSNVDGRPLDEPEFAPLFDAVGKHGLPIWLHPARTAETPDYRSEKMSRFDAWSRFGWPYETSVAMYRIVLSGAFDRSAVSVIAHHCGAMLPMFEGRVARGFATAGMRSRDTDYVDRIKGLKRPPMDYFRTCFYGDTALSGGSIGLKCGLEFFGTEHVLFASDAPFNDVRAPLEAFKSLALDAKANEAIYVRNAERLLKRKFA